MIGLRVRLLITVVIAAVLTGACAASQADSYEVTLQSENGWEIMTFSGTKANRVSFSERGMLIAVNQSASPLIFPLPITAILKCQ